MVECEVRTLERKVFVIERMKHSLNVHFSDKTYNILRDYANHRDMPMAQIVRIAVQNYFSRKGFYTK